MIFIAMNEPSEIATGGSVGQNAFTLIYYLLPLWQVEVASGGLNIH